MDSQASLGSGEGGNLKSMTWLVNYVHLLKSNVYEFLMFSELHHNSPLGKST